MVNMSSLRPIVGNVACVRVIEIITSFTHIDIEGSTLEIKPNRIEIRVDMGWVSQDGTSQHHPFSFKSVGWLCPCCWSNTLNPKP